MEKDYAEMLCQSVAYLIDRRLENISYDITILCIVEDDSRATEGIYTVSYGAAKYEAVSLNTKYKKGANVYVQIPQGDWNEQKTIISQKATKNSTPITYIDPFDNFADVTANLISESQKGYGGLIAADPGVGITGTPVENIKIGYLARERLDNEDGFRFLGTLPTNIDYTRLGISAEFKSLLGQFQPTAGDYGLKFDITFKAIDSDITEDVSIYFSSEDMVGNPYLFNGFTRQEQLFNIEQFTQCSIIERIKITFYQKGDSFKDKNGHKFNYGYRIGDPQINPNLFVQDIYIALGYDLGNFKGEHVKIHTEDSSSYCGKTDIEISESGSSAPQEKKLQLSWIHQVEDKFTEIAESNAPKHILTWYRKKVGEPAPNIVIGEGWSVISTQEISYEAKNYKILDKDILNYNANLSEGQEALEPSFNTTWLIPSIHNASEEVKAMVAWGDNLEYSIISEPISFENSKPVVNNVAKHQMIALEISCEDGSQGNYPIYRRDGVMIDSGNAYIERALKLYFRAYDDETDQIGEKVELSEAESIVWETPSDDSKTMITIIQKNDNNPILKYKIKTRLNQNNRTDNTIRAKIVKDGIEYEAKLDMEFMVAGTSGTDYTFDLDFVKEPALSLDRPDESIEVSATIYDYDGTDVTDKCQSFTWEWLFGEDGISKSSSDSRTVSLSLSVNEMPQEGNYNILKAVAEMENNIKLTTYLPIPIRLNYEDSYIQGASEIKYNSLGYLDDMSYYQGPYRICSSSGDVKYGEEIKWEIVSDNDNKYLPRINDYNCLVPAIIYAQPENDYYKVCVNAKNSEGIIWSQPIFIYQNKYPSSILDKWDGELTIDKENNQVLAARLVAGSKNNLGEFTGLMLGDFENTNSEQSSGLYGFCDGVSTFGLETDGTAFFGKSGGGRIVIDGNESTIKNANKTMIIDLDDGTIEMKESSSTGETSKNSAANPYPLTIGNNFRVSWDGEIEGRRAMFEESSIQGEYGKIGSLTGTRILIDEGSCFLNQFSPNMNTNRMFIHKKFEIKYLLQYYKDGKWNPLHEAIENGYQLNEDLIFDVGLGNSVDISSLEKKLDKLEDELEALNEQLAKDEAEFAADPKVIELQAELKQLEAQLDATLSGDTMALERNISSIKVAISNIRKDYLEATTDEIKLKKEAIANTERQIQNAQSQNDAFFDKKTSIFTDTYDYSYKFNENTNSVESEFNEGNLPSLSEYCLIEITEDDEEKIYSETLAWFLNGIEAKGDESRGLIGLVPGVTVNGNVYEATHNVGIQAHSDANIVIEGNPERENGTYIRLGCADNTDNITIKAKKISFEVDKENQTGIYARFA